MDILFMLDSSRSVSKAEFETEKELVKKIARQYKVSQNYTRAAAISYGSNPFLSITFDRYTDIVGFSKAVDSEIPYLGGSKNLSKALESAKNIFQVNSRRGTPKVLVVLVKGEVSSTGVPAARAIAKQLRNNLVSVYVIGILKGLISNQYATIVTRANNVIIDDSFDGPLQDSPRIAQYICVHAGGYSCGIEPGSVQGHL